MNSIEDLLAKLANTHGLKPQREGDGWGVQLPQRGNLSCKLTIGPEVLEWYAIVSGIEDPPLWEGWMDYTGYGESSASTLLVHKSRDILCFVEQWLRSSQIRIKETRSLLGLVHARSLEAERDGQWREVRMFSSAT